ncbi:methyl-CpG-binding domain protein 1-like, partial [Pezoporus wallicus]|uniref:methyl-CpG-binding domain protein 1-like n=1 Tax=Pezoporus wallicus TaxID=35540 RepID=UPI00254EAF6A
VCGGLILFPPPRSCAGCQGLFPGVTLPTQRRCRWLCPECRARRRDFNREQRFFKRVGCGSCQACRIPQDCGICSACARPPPAQGPKCLLRRCLRIVKRGLGCGSCPGCVATEDCGSCCICLRRLQPGLKRQWRCLRRRCQQPKKSTRKKTSSVRTVKWKPPQEREPSAAPSTRHRKQLNKGKEKKKPGRPPKHPGGRGGGRGGRRRRSSRRCGLCGPCLRPGDCGRCDFCRDKPKFGGQNLKRQKCRWRQCLRCATRRLLPVGVRLRPPSRPRPLRRPPRPARSRCPPCKAKEQAMRGGEKGHGPPPPGPPMGIKEEPGPPLPNLQDPRLGLLIASAPRLKVAPPEPSVTPRPVTATPHHGPPISPPMTPSIHPISPHFTPYDPQFHPISPHFTPYDPQFHPISPHFTPYDPINSPHQPPFHPL